MADKEFRSIEDILEDPDLDDIIKPLEKKAKPIATDPDVQALQEVEDWVKENGRKPENTRKDLKERSMFHKLKGMMKKYTKLKPYDTMGLLIQEDTSKLDKLKDEIKEDTNTAGFSTLDDVLGDNSVLFDDLDKMDSLDTNFFNTEKVTRKAPTYTEKFAQRHKMANFEPYKAKFDLVQSDLASGRRKLMPFKNYEIILHHYYVLKGQLIYIDAFGEEEEKDNKNGRYQDRRVHVIYENGTESNVLYRGLGSSLYGANGKLVTDLETGELNLSSDDYQTGYIYVVKSLSKNPKIANVKSLYKVGFTAGSVKRRIANAENESTYLYAPVKLIEQFQVINLNPEALETAIHHALADYRFGVQITAPNGKMLTPREWFVIDLPEIEKIVNQIIVQLQSEQ